MQNQRKVNIGSWRHHLNEFFKIVSYYIACSDVVFDVSQKHFDIVCDHAGFDTSEHDTFLIETWQTCKYLF